MLEFFHCPRHPDGSVQSLDLVCNYRKPKLGLLIQDGNELGINMPSSIFIGDKLTDIEAARAAGVGNAYSLAHANAENLIEALNARGNFNHLIN